MKYLLNGSFSAIKVTGVLCITLLFITNWYNPANASLKPYERSNTMRDASPLLFGARNNPSHNLGAFPKWVSAMARNELEQKNASSTCSPAANNCRLGKWKKYVSSIKNYPTDSQVILINDYVNRQEYVRDSVSWQVNDYWATPKQFFEVGGDCEDYAITKFISLRMLGIPNESMRIVVLDDLHSRSIHAVLAVDIAGKTYILDNQVKKVTLARNLRHYRPIYSLNEKSWWKHKA